MRESSSIILVAILLAGVSSCSRESDGPAVPDQDTIASLAGTEWVLQVFGSEGAEEPAVPPPPLP